MPVSATLCQTLACETTDTPTAYIKYKIAIL